MSNVQLDPAGDPPDAVLPHTPKELFRDPSEWRHFLSAYGPEGRAVHDLHLGGVLADPGWKPYGPHVRIGEEAPFRECFSDLPEGPILRAVREALSGAIELREYRLASLSRKEGNGSVSSVPILARGDRVVAIFHGETAYLAEHAHHLLQHLIAERNLLASKPDAHAPAIDAVVHF